MPNFFAPCAKGLEYLLVDELNQLGAKSVREALAGVYFSGDLAIGYRAILWSRLASRILLLLEQTEISNVDELYESVSSINWGEHFSNQDRFIVDFIGSNEFINHTQFGAQKVKDAIVDQFRDKTGARPNIDNVSPNLRINVSLRKNKLSLSLDLSGHALHARGYRAQAGDAPMKETLAAAMLLRAGWPEHSAQGGALVDPMCGAGTLLIEAAWMQRDRAPGLMRDDFGFNQGWLQHDAVIWEELLVEARLRADQATQQTHAMLYGMDADATIIKKAWMNSQLAAVNDGISWEASGLNELARPDQSENYLVVCNPPYGERLGDVDELSEVYGLLGEKLSSEFSDGRAAVLTSEASLAESIGLRSHKQYSMYNGRLACKLYLFELGKSAIRRTKQSTELELSEGASAFRNRLSKNRKHLASWIKKQNIECYRIYDADIPEYSAAIDVYAGAVYLQEYKAPASVSVLLAQTRLEEMATVCADVFKLPRNDIHVASRSRQKGADQYQKRDIKGDFFVVHEAGLKFWVNLHQYLDTGLFLDHRITRDLLRQRAQGQRFLNLFAYTGSASVYAADGGAMSTLSIDMSNTYCDWAHRNLLLNGFDQRQHSIEQADVLAWLTSCRQEFDLIFVDPPTFSNSKRMQEIFDVQRDYVQLLRNCLKILSRQGEIIFSTNSRKFKFDQESFADCRLENLSHSTLPVDFHRNPKIHQCWSIRWD